MKPVPRPLAFALLPALLAGAASLLLPGCDRSAAVSAPPVSAAPPASPPTRPELPAWVLVPPAGDVPTDREIRRFQDRIRSGDETKGGEAAVEGLGWTFVKRARETCDPGFYKLAEACGAAIEAATPGAPEGLLLRAHAWQNLHRFREAEPLARELVARRGLSFDHALLGDVLMEQGRLDEAIPAYQRALDLRPDVHSYARAAHVRWLLGDVDGAAELMQAAVGASSPRDGAAQAWVCTRLGLLDFQRGRLDEARQAIDAALAVARDYPPALLLRGRLRLAEGDAAGALAPLELAAEKNPLPETQWALAEALRAAGEAARADAVEETLRAGGAVADPRTLALYLATRGLEPAEAVRLAEAEMTERRDVFTRDALAWTLAAAGRLPEARAEMERALAEGTADARLFFHAAVIAHRAGEPSEAREWLALARDLERMLLPSERAELRALTASLTGNDPKSSATQTPGEKEPKPQT